MANLAYRKQLAIERHFDKVLSSWRRGTWRVTLAAGNEATATREKDAYRRKIARMLGGISMGATDASCRTLSEARPWIDAMLKACLAEECRDIIQRTAEAIEANPWRQRPFCFFDFTEEFYLGDCWPRVGDVVVHEDLVETMRTLIDWREAQVAEAGWAASAGLSYREAKDAAFAWRSGLRLLPSDGGLTVLEFGDGHEIVWLETAAALEHQSRALGQTIALQMGRSRDLNPRIFSLNRPDGQALGTLYEDEGIVEVLNFEERVTDGLAQYAEVLQLWISLIEDQHGDTDLAYSYRQRVLDGTYAPEYSDLILSCRSVKYRYVVKFKNNILHCDDGPAARLVADVWEGRRHDRYHQTKYYRNGVLHRDGGPALICGRIQAWYSNGTLIREETVEPDVLATDLVAGDL